MSEPDDPKVPSEIEYYLQKGAAHRVVYADGAFGGVTPRGLIHMALFSERFPLPVTLRKEVKDGKIGAELGREGKEGVIRDIEVSVILQPETAVHLAKWLLAKAVDAGVDFEAAGIEASPAEDATDSERREGESGPNDSE